MRNTNERRFVHLGERLAAIERVRAGVTTRAEAAAELGIDEAQLAQWIELHANDRLVTLEELRSSRSTRLAARARRLAELLAAAERRVRELHLELVAKEFGEKPHPDLESVARAQPHA